MKASIVIFKKVNCVTLITARVRSMTGRYCFHRCLSVHRGGGGSGYPPPPGGGSGYPPWGGPGPPWGGLGPPWGVRVPPGGVWVPPQGVWVPPWGVRVPPGGGPGTPPGGGTQVGQQKEYSLHSGRYASCVHAGGLSCSRLLFLLSHPHITFQSSFGNKLNGHDVTSHNYRYLLLTWRETQPSTATVHDVHKILLAAR